MLEAAAAQARAAELEVVEVATAVDELHRALRRVEVDVVLLYDALGGTPVLDLARDLAAANPEVGLILLAAAEEPGLLRAAMQAGLRDVVSLPLSPESFASGVRAAAERSRTMRDRVAGEESANAAHGGQLVAVAGAKGGVGTTTTALHLGLAAARMAPGRPICLVDFDLQKGDLRTLLDTPHQRSVVDLAGAAHEISVRHLQEALYTHRQGFRLLLAPEEGERAEDVDADGRPQRAERGQGAPRPDDRRHRRRHRPGGHDRRRAGRPRARRHHAGRARPARRAAHARPLEAPRGGRGG